MDHGGLFDTLRSGNILAVPIFDSLGDVGKWEYKMPYQMLVVCDEANTYRLIGIKGSEDHVEMANDTDVQRATDLLSEATMLLADSLRINWEKLYKGFDESEQKRCIENMLADLNDVG
jgi:hypothetical protein